MYCPKCGQQQLSDEVRFCSRCGFRLSTVKELLASDGDLIMPQSGAHGRELSPRQKGQRFGAKLLFWSIVGLPVAIALSIAVDSPGPLIIPLIAFFIGLMRILYARLFQESGLPAGHQAQSVLAGGAERKSALPASHSVPATGFSAQRKDTAEVMRPPSITEGTTKLLDNDSEPRFR
jgi:hypothetical protein